MNDIYRVPNMMSNASAGLITNPSITFMEDDLVFQVIFLYKVRRSFRIDVSEAIGTGFEDNCTGELISL